MHRFGRPAGSARTAFDMRAVRRTAPAAAVLVSCFGLAQAAELTDLSFEQLLDTTVTGASKYEQKQSEVAAAVSVITRAEIEAFGWRSLAEALSSLPGIYTTYDRQYSYVGTRGFSAPGDYNTRMLLTVDGNRVNDAVFDQAFVGTALTIAMAVATYFFLLYPDVMPSSTDPAYSLTIENASSTDYTLKIMTIAAVIFTPIVLLYQGWTYWVFRKRIRVEHIPAAQDPLIHAESR